MDKGTLTISLPREMKTFTTSTVGEVLFSTPSQSIRSLIRADQEDGSSEELSSVSNIRFGLSKLTRLSPKDWQIVEALILKSRSTRPLPNRNSRKANSAST